MSEQRTFSYSLDTVERPLTSSKKDTFKSKLQQAVHDARHALLELQHANGYWRFPLQADCTIPAEYILMMHFMGTIDQELQAKIAVFIKEQQDSHDGWSLYPGGKFDMSCTVKAYYALKLAGDSTDAPHMIRARRAILTHGGAAKSNVFTRITLALFEQVPWRATPFVPVEMMLLPRWFPFHISKVSYWSRTVMVPLSILCSLKAKAKNPNQVHIQELFVTPPDLEQNYFVMRSFYNRIFFLIERVARLFEPAIPKWIRAKAIRKAESWFIERLNGIDGLGAIFPAMVNAYEALSLLNYPSDHPHCVTARRALQKLLVINETNAYCQPCTSPIWDTALAVLAVHEADGRIPELWTLRALDWLKERQLLDEPGDWREYRPHLPGGGWPFQYGNDHYPDIDDTAAVAWAMQQVHPKRYQESIRRAAIWTQGMQSKNGGFAAFDADNTYYYLNEIPFADHGALLDPPTSDVSGRCMTLFLRLNNPSYQVTMERCLAFLRNEQEKNGSWFGRWGTNYIYGTWSVLAAFEGASSVRNEVFIQRAVAWLKSVQRPDGGWGESNDTYFDPESTGQGETSTAYQTAWAMLGLMAAGIKDCPELQRGAEYLLRSQQPDGLWDDPSFTAPGFPRVFHLKYHGYDKYFPLWALARYYNLNYNREFKQGA